MSSNSLKIALLCSDAAKEFIKNNSEFEIIGSIVKNSDVVVLNKENPSKIAVSQKRNKDLDLIKKQFKNQVEVIQTLHNILPYVLEKGEADGAVMDAKNAIFVNGDKKGAYGIIGDYDSYVMVANKKFMDSIEFKEFLNLYNKSVDDINSDSDKEFEAIKLLYEKEEFTKKEMDLWKEWKVKFLKIQ